MNATRDAVLIASTPTHPHTNTTMAVHVREPADLYSKEKRAWFSTNNDPESVEVYQLNSFV